MCKRLGPVRVRSSKYPLFFSSFFFFFFLLNRLFFFFSPLLLLLLLFFFFSSSSSSSSSSSQFSSSSSSSTSSSSSSDTLKFAVAYISFNTIVLPVCVINHCVHPYVGFQGYVAASLQPYRSGGAGGVHLLTQHKLCSLHLLFCGCCCC